MILGIGLDIVEIARIGKIYQNFGLAFANKILHAAEIAHLHAALNKKNTPAIGERHAIEFLATRFAAKEAAVKALGTGFANGILPKHIGITNLPSGKPELIFYDKALERATSLQVCSTHISLTHEKNTAAAMVVLES